MTRWREPGEKSSPYITAEGYRVLETGLQELWQRRANVTRALSAAAAEGDRSENAEYIYRKRELGGIDSRIAYLQRRMPTLKIVSGLRNHTQVFFGAWVVLENDAGERNCYRIVGADELGHDDQYISVDSPLAKAMLGKSAGDDLGIAIGPLVQKYQVVSIHYTLPAGSGPGEG